MNEFDVSLFPDFDNFEEIGRGGFARVFSAQHILTGIRIAIKFISKKNLNSTFNDKNFQRELNTFKDLDHPFIAHFIKYIETETSYYILMELAGHGTLLNKINDFELRDIEQVRKIFIQIIAVLIYLHQIKHIIHRDIKLENILFDDRDNVKMIDFGLCSTITTKNTTFKTLCGSYPYAAPEIFLQQPYTEKVDIWSLGVVLYAMCAGCLPFENSNTALLVREIVTNDPEWPDADPFVVDLLQKMLTKNPELRINLNDIIAHPFVQRGGNFTYYLGNSFNNSPFYKIVPTPGFPLDKEITMQMHNSGLTPSQVFYDTMERTYYLICRCRNIAKVADDVPEKRHRQDLEPHVLNTFATYNTSQIIGSPAGANSARTSLSRGRSSIAFSNKKNIIIPVPYRTGRVYRTHI